MLELEQAQVPAARDAVRHALEEVRRIARELRPEALDHLGLQSALRSLCTATAAHPGLRVERRLELGDTELDPDVELVVYRIAQESLTNVRRHAEASEVLVALGTVDGGLRLVVRDDGRGLPADVDTGEGITGMRERALLIGGRLTVTAPRGGGTEVRLDVPLP
jgi:two-component system sensor histidine kinase UhpB